MNTDRLHNIKRNFNNGFLRRIVDLLFPFVINTVVIYTIGVEYLGLNSLFASILQILSLAELGVGSALMYSMYEPMAVGDADKICCLLSFYRKIYLAIGLVICLLGIGCVPFLEHLIEGEIPDGINIYVLFFINLANTSVSYFLFAYRASLLQAEQRIDIKEKISMCTNICMYIGKILILLLTKNYYLFCLIVPVFTTVDNLVVWRITKRRYPQYVCKGRLSKDEVNNLKTRAVGIFINRLCDVMCNSFDTIVISAFLGLTILGEYNNYFFIMNAVGILAGSIVVSSIPSIGNAVATETVEQNYKNFNVLQFGYSWLIGWCTVCLVCLMQPFIELWVGTEKMLGMSVVFCLCGFFYFQKTNEVYMAYRQAAGIWNHDRVRPFVEAVLNLSINICLVQIIGVEGVLIASIFTMGFIRIIWASRYLFKEYFIEYGQKRFLLRLLFYSIITACSTGATFYLCSLLNLSGILCLLARGGICIVVPNAVFFAAYHRLPEFKALISLKKKK